MANKPDNGKKVVFRISWFYIIFIGLLIWMFMDNSEVGPKKIEWAEVKEIWQSGDVEEVTFIRNEFEAIKNNYSPEVVAEIQRFLDSNEYMTMDINVMHERRENKD